MKTEIETLRAELSALFAQRDELIRMLTDLLKALVPYQDDESGLWYQVVNRVDDPRNWLETSCSCLYTGGIAGAVRRGFLDRSYLKFARKGYDMAVEQTDGCAGFIVISDNDTPRDYVNAGMHLMEVWLYAVRNNIEVHPMSYAVENPSRRIELQRSLKLLNPPQMILRVGMIDGVYGENAQVRRDLKDYITVEK